MTPTEQGITIGISVIVSAVITVAWFVIRHLITEGRERKAQRDAEWLDRETAAGRREAEWFEREMERNRQHLRDMAELRLMQERMQRAHRNRAAAGVMRRRIARQTSIGVRMRNKNRRPHRALDREYNLMRMK